MMKPLLVAVAAIFTLQPALAAPTLNAVSVYADKDVDLAGGSYGPIACLDCGTVPPPPSSYANAGASVGALSDSSATLTQQAKDISADFKSMPGTAYSITGPNDFNKTLTGVAGVNVVNFTQAEIDDIEVKLTIADVGITQLIFNIPGLNADVALFELMLPNSLTSDKVLFNFFEATDVSGAGKTIHGTILAPYALVDISGLTVDGIIVSDRFNAANVNVLGNGFNFGPPPVVPEPATWALLILGFGVVGAAMRRRAAAKPALAA